MSESWRNPIDNGEPCFPHDNIVGDHLCDECKLSNELRVCHRLLVHFVIAGTILFTDQRMSGLPILAKYTHFGTICEHTFDNSPSDSSFSFLKWWSSKQGVETFNNSTVFLFVSSRYLIALVRMTFHIVWPRHSFCVRSLPPRQFFMASPQAGFWCRLFWFWFWGPSWSCPTTNLTQLQQNFVIRTSFCIIQKGFRSDCIHVEYIPNTHGQETMLVLQDRPVSSISSTWEPHAACFLPAMSMSSTCTDENNHCFLWTKRHSQFGTFFYILVPVELSQVVFHTRGEQVGDRTDFVQEEPLGLQCLTRIPRPLMSWKT